MIEKYFIISLKYQMVNYSFLKFDKSTQLRYKPYSNIISRIIWQHCERNKNDFKRLRSYFK